MPKVYSGHFKNPTNMIFRAGSEATRLNIRTESVILTDLARISLRCVKLPLFGLLVLQQACYTSHIYIHILHNLTNF